MINYYKILGLPDFSRFDEVKQAYRSKAKQFHPDVNPSNEADDIFKLVNEAYQVLSNPQTKERFDYALKYSLNFHYRKRTTTVDPAETRRREAIKRRKKSQEFRKKRFLQRFEKANVRFPYKFRFAIFGLGALSALLLTYQNWFVNEASRSEAVELGLSLVTFFILWVVFCSNLYRYWRYRYLLSGNRPNYEIQVVRWMIVVLLFAPLVINIISQFQKEYELEHYGVERLANLSTVYSSEEIQYSFRVDGVLYKKTVEVKPGIKIDDQYRWVAIVYSSINPRISDLNIKQ